MRDRVRGKSGQHSPEVRAASLKTVLLNRRREVGQLCSDCEQWLLDSAVGRGRDRIVLAMRAQAMW